MAKLVEANHCKRDRGHISEEYIYYDKKTNRFPHSLLLTEFYIKLLEIGCEILEYYVEREIGNIRPDGIFVVKYKDTTYLFAIEVQLSNNYINVDKYIDLYKSGKWKPYMPTFPKVVFIVDRNLPKVESPIPFIKLNTDLQNLESIFG